MFPATPVRWIPNGIDTSVWTLEPHDVERARAWRGSEVAPGRRVLGLFGQLKAKKGGSFFLDALRRSGHDGRFHLLLVGDAEPEMLARLLSIESAASWTHVPFVDRWELLPYYAACDLVVIPSHYDGLPNVLLEAGALGVPPLASTAGAMPDLLGDGENALLFRAGDPHDCRRAIDVAAAIPDDALRELGRRLSETVARDFHARAEAARYLEALRDTAGATAGEPHLPYQERTP
jgi:glycosyltransferase involved in cell wall biosynthesis